MRKATLILLKFVVSGLFVFSPHVVARPVFTGDGSFSCAFDVASASLTVDAALTVEASWDDLTAGFLLTVDAIGPTTLEGTWAAALDELTLSADIALDIQSASFTQAGASVTVPGEENDLTLTGVLEEGFGLGVTFTGSGVLHTIEVGLNLDRCRRVQTDSCTLPFTYAAAEAVIPVTDCVTVDAELLVDAAGFAELVLSCSDIRELPIGVQFAATLVFEPAAKTLDLSPSFSVESDECIDLYAGLSWDAVSHTISGIEVYGLGLRCELGEVAVRGLWALDPTTIALVKAPYWALLGLVWELPGCCGDVGEGSVAVFFGSAGGALFDVGEIDAEIVLPLSEAATVTIGALLPVNGNAIFAVSWSIAF